MIDRERDIFFLRREELWAAVQQGETGPEEKKRYRQLAEERREQWEAQRRLSAPDRIPPARHPVWQRKGLVYWGDGELHQGPGGAWFSGIGASPGRVRGRARVLTSPADFHKLQKGDILVTVALTPAWTSLFSIAAAAVAEAGGVTSHASIVAREYGIPVVVGTGIARQVIEEGQVITVDGSKGIVYL
jgi:rifampicin phosphotransferase